jgi:hypothetical protein
MLSYYGNSGKYIAAEGFIYDTLGLELENCLSHRLDAKL